MASSSTCSETSCNACARVSTPQRAVSASSCWRIGQRCELRGRNRLRSRGLWTLISRLCTNLGALPGQTLLCRPGRAPTIPAMASAGDGLEHLVGHVEVGPHVLHVVGVLERV